MNALVSLFVTRPVNISIVALAFSLGYLVLRFSGLGASRRPHAVLVAAIAWWLYAAWEWLVMLRTPEADIRVDLLLIWPVFAIASAWALVGALWPRRSGRS
jgi:hypothetical protein